MSKRLHGITFLIGLLLLVSIVLVTMFVAPLLAQDDGLGGARLPVEFTVGRVDVVPPGLLLVAVIPPYVALDVGATMQFDAICEYADGFIDDSCGDQMFWVSMNPEIITVSVTGSATGISIGPATVAATLRGD